MSCPSISITFQPNARQRSASWLPVYGVMRSSRDLAGPAELLQLVVVDDGDDVVEAVAGSDVCAFPNDALVAFAVTEHDVGREVAAFGTGAEGDAESSGESESQRTGRHVDAGGDRHVRMALEA